MPTNNIQLIISFNLGHLKVPISHLGHLMDHILPFRTFEGSPLTAVGGGDLWFALSCSLLGPSLK